MGGSLSCRAASSPSPSLQDFQQGNLRNHSGSTSRTPSPRPPISASTPGNKGKQRATHQSSSGSLTPSSLKSRTRTKQSASSTRLSVYEMSSRPALHALRDYATLPSPSTSLAPSTLLLSNPQCIAIFDTYPKAKYHFLVLPRYPFPSQSNPDSKKSLIRLDAMNDLRSLLTKGGIDERAEVVRAMADMAREVEEMVRDEMFKTEGFEWRIDVGFHAIPSMKHIHLHVIAEDRISPALKTKKHYNSFRPDLGFFIDIMEVQRWLASGHEVVTERLDALNNAHTLLDTPLTCFKCDEPFSNVPKLKTHLLEEYQEEKKKETRRIAKYGRGRSEEGDMF